MEELMFTHEQVMEILPHGGEMLLLDEITELVPGKHAVGWYRVNPELDVLRGHFSGDPTLPGAYTLEVSNQVASVLIASTPELRNEHCAFLGVNRSRFHKRMRPGDLLVTCSAILSEKTENGIVTVLNKVYGNNELAAEIEVVFSLGGLKPAQNMGEKLLPEELLYNDGKRSMSNQEILNYTRIRDPYRLLDQFPEMIPGKYAIGEFYVDPVMPVLKDYQPAAPVLPGFYLIESTEQVGGIMVASCEDFADKRSLLLGINRARLYRNVYPGETVKTYSHIANIRRDKFIITYANKAYVGAELVAETEIAIAMR